MLMTIGRVFGWKGILVAAVVGGVLWKLGVDPSVLLGGGGAGTPQAMVSSDDQARFNFVKVVVI